jgi:putative FmdB family regulatory protein
MPTYEYRCLECGRAFEAFQSMSEKPLVQCRYCQGKVKRLIGAGAGVIFKGSGFYCTDYRSGSYRKEAKQEGTGGSGAAPASTPSQPVPATSEGQSSSKAGAADTAKPAAASSSTPK